MSEDDAWLTSMAEIDWDIDSARKIARPKRPTYKGNAMVLPDDDPLSVEWSLWDELYG